MTIRDTDRTYRFIASLMAAGLLFLAACDADSPGLMDAPPADEAVTLTFDPPEPDQRMEVPGKTSSAAARVPFIGRYRAAGGLTDEGRYTEHLTERTWLDHTNLSGWQRLTGTQGTARILYTGTLIDGTRRVRGIAEIIEGTGAYGPFKHGTAAFELDLVNPRAAKTIRITKPIAR